MKFVYGVYILLLLSAFTSGIRFDVPVGSSIVPVSLSQIFSILLVIHYLVARKRILTTMAGTSSTCTFLIILYFLSNVVSSIFFSPTSVQSLRSCINIFGFFVIYFIVKQYTRYLKEEEKAIDKLYWMNVGSMIFGLCMVVISIVDIAYENIGVSTGHVEGTSSIRSLSHEPNFFSMITAVVGVFTLTALLTKNKKHGNYFILLLITVSVLLSYTRSVYVSVAVVMVIMGIMLFKFYSAYLLRFTYLLVAAFVFLVIIVSGSGIHSFLVGRITEMFNFEEGSGQARVIAYQLVYDETVEHPLMGNGTMSANTGTYNAFTGAPQYVFGGPGWLSGAWIQSMHDTGIVGFIILMSIFLYMIWINYTAYKENRTTERGWYFLAFFGGNIILSITAQVSSSLYISFPWIYWGINEAFLSTYRTHNSASTNGFA
jgi:O-Antigen ligase